MQERPISPSEKIVATLRDKEIWITLAKIEELESLNVKHGLNNTYTDCSVVNGIVADRLKELNTQLTLLREDLV